MRAAPTNPVVHLELHTGNLPRACSFYAEVFGWRAETVNAGSRSYLALDLGDAFEGGGVECGIDSPLWLPYVEVTDVTKTTARARSMGASVLLWPSEGPAGWRSVVRAPDGAEVALWQQKR